MSQLHSRGSRFRVCALLVASSGLLFSQGSPVGNITGTVKAPGGKVMPGLLVQAITPRGTLETRTNERGQFLFGQLVPSRVIVKVVAKGFSAFQAETLVVVNQTASMNVNLQPEGRAVVEVIDYLPTGTTDAAQAKTGVVATMDTVADLPLMASSSYAIVDFYVQRAPGADYSTIHGTDANQNAFQVDGIDTASAKDGSRATRINDDFVDQIQVLTGGISAKYGQNSGAVVNITTKSGSNEFTGSSRFDVTNAKWDSRGKLSDLYALFGIKQTKPVDAHSILQSFTGTGPIIKDKLFFAAAYQTTVPMKIGHYTTGSTDFGGVPYTTEKDTTVKDLKLDWAIDASNRVSAAWNESREYKKNFGSPGYATTLETLSGKSITKKGYWALGYTSTLSNNLLLDVKVNDTTSKSGGPGTGPTGGDNVVTWESTKPSYGGDVLDNGLGSSQPVTSHMRNMSANLTWFVQGAGEHQVEAGIQSFGYIYKAAAAVTPSGYEVHFYGYTSGSTSSALANRVLVVNNAAQTYLEAFESIAGRVDTHVTSLYFNDTWKMNDRWTANLGLRYDKYHSNTSPEDNNYNFDALSPRLGLTYDLTGTRAHLLNVSYSVYTGKILQGQLAAASVSQTPIEKKYVYLGTGGANQGLGTDALTSTGGINWAAWGNSAGQTGQGNPTYVSDPLLNRNVFVDPNIKAPRTREVNLGYRHEVNGQSFSANLIRRWSDRIIDDFWYGDGVSAGVAKVVIKNDPDGRQDYYGLELAYRKVLSSAFTVGANLTWARTLENAGETLGGSSSPANNFGDSISNSQLQPYGSAPGLDTPLMMNADVTYVCKIGPGRFNVGLLGTFRGRTAVAFKCGTALTPDSLTSQGYDTMYTRYFPELGVNRNPSYYWFDLQTGYELTVAKKNKLYVRVNVQNVLNQLRRSGTFYSGYVVDAQGNYYPSDGTLASNKYLEDSTSGISSSYQDPRTVGITFGYKF